MSINADWEKFLGGPIKLPKDRLHASISRHSVIAINARVFQMIGKPEAVALYFNRREQKIGVKAASPRFHEAFPIKKYGGTDTTRYVNAASFCSHYGISITETHKFNRPEMAADGMLVLNLNDTTVVKRLRNRNSKKA